MLRPNRPLNKDRREEVEAMDINSFTVFLFRWLKENLSTLLTEIVIVSAI